MTANLGKTNSFDRLRPVTPHASLDLPDGPCRGLWVNDTGLVTVSVIANGDTAAVPMKVYGPGPLVVAARAVRAAGTTALDIVAGY